MSDRAFVDTNVLVYAYDRDAGSKHDTARDLIAGLWESRTGVVSTQVLQEFYVNVRRKAKRPMSRSDAVRLIEGYLAWDVVVNDAESITGAIVDEEKYGISFWDALIVGAARAAGVSVLFTEDLNHGQLYGGVEAVNPFLAV